MLNGEMLSGLTGKLRSLAHQQLEAREADGPLVRRLRDVVSTFIFDAGMYRNSSLYRNRVFFDSSA